MGSRLRIRSSRLGILSSNLGILIGRWHKIWLGITLSNWYVRQCRSNLIELLGQILLRMVTESNTGWRTIWCDN